MESKASYRSGLMNGMAAFGWWAVVLPLLLVWMNHLAARAGHFTTDGASRLDWSLELLAHRAIWAVVTCVVLLRWGGGWGEVVRLVNSRRTTLLLALTALLILVNWLGFVYGAATGRFRYTSLGYYINPLVSVALGVAVLGERLRHLQILAVAVATMGVAWEAWHLGHLPWISLLVAFSFGLYGLFRKRIVATAIPALFLEGFWLLPLAFGYIAYREVLGSTPMFGRDPLVSLLLVFAGVATAAPLIWFANAAQRIPLSTVAFLQFVVPTGQLLVAVTLNGETLTSAGMVTFGLIWLAVGVFLFDVRLATRKEPPQTGGALLEIQ